MWFVGQIGKSSKGNPLWSYKQTLTLNFCTWMRSTYLRQISSVHTAAKPLAAQDNEEKTFCSSMICFPAMWQCWRTIKITIVGGDGQGRIWAEWHCEYADPQVWPVQWRGAPCQDPDGSRAAAPPRPCCLLQPLLLLQHPWKAILVIMRCRLTFLPHPSRGAQC